MLKSPSHLELFQRPESLDSIRDLLRRLEVTVQQPSAHELLTQVEQLVGLDARWDLVAAIFAHSKDEEVSDSFRDYLSSLLVDDAVPQALRGEGTPDKEAISSIDALLLQSRRYQDTDVPTSPHRPKVRILAATDAMKLHTWIDGIEL
jgi:hypothetical protein